MTPDERVAEMRQLAEPIGWTADQFMGRVTELVGFPIQHIDVALAWDKLIERARENNAL